MDLAMPTLAQRASACQEAPIDLTSFFRGRSISRMQQVQITIIGIITAHPGA
jgi:hypothetical protein